MLEEKQKLDEKMDEKPKIIEKTQFTFDVETLTTLFANCQIEFFNNLIGVIRDTDDRMIGYIEFTNIEGLQLAWKTDKNKLLEKKAKQIGLSNLVLKKV